MKKPGTEKNPYEKIDELIQLNDELENYFRNTIIPQLFVDANLILRKFSPPNMKHFSLEESHIGKSMEEIKDHIRYSTIIEDIKEVMESGEVFEKEVQSTDKRWFQMNILPYVIKKLNKTNGVIITFVDITERINSLNELERLNASHETFIYSVSHDLKEPLSSIEGLVKHLIKISGESYKHTGEEENNYQAILQMLDTSVKSMKDIIDELSDIVKIEENFKEQVEPISFINILQEVEMMLNGKIRESQATITYDIQVHEIKISRKNIRSILYNLISNALKYHHPDKAPEIFISTGMQDGMLHISVKDNGLGIAKDKQKLIFKPFTRVQNNVDGTGIGLHLVKTIVENNGGKISVNSKEGEGAQFNIYLENNI